jgi:hypothetical protein
MRFFEGRTVCCIATGPSLAQYDIDVARQKGFALFGCNNVWELTKLDVLYCCNENWWDHYWSPTLAEYPASKWTGSKEAAKRYGLNWINGYDRPGLSSNPDYVHHGHGSGFSLVNLAFLMGARRIVLLGYDLKYAPDYQGPTEQPGSTPRHYFGEYPKALQHWPRMEVRGGVHVGLVQRYESVAKQGAVEIINCSRDTALTCFQRMSIDAV